MSLKSKIQALITAANAKTGESDATLTDAVQTLVDGYGGGGAPVINPLSITANGTYTAPSGVDGYSPVTVNVPQGITPTGKITITENGTDIDVAQYALADVNVQGGGGGNLGTKYYEIYSTEIIVGENLVTNTMQARDYFLDALSLTSLAGCVYSLAENCTVNNQIVGGRLSDSNMFRYRNNAIGTATINTSFDAKLVAGTKYVAVVVSEFNTSDPTPY